MGANKCGSLVNINYHPYAFTTALQPVTCSPSVKQIKIKEFVAVLVCLFSHISVSFACMGHKFSGRARRNKGIVCAFKNFQKSPGDRNLRMKGSAKLYTII